MSVIILLILLRSFLMPWKIAVVYFQIGTFSAHTATMPRLRSRSTQTPTTHLVYSKSASFSRMPSATTWSPSVRHRLQISQTPQSRNSQRPRHRSVQHTAQPSSGHNQHPQSRAAQHTTQPSLRYHHTSAAPLSIQEWPGKGPERLGLDVARQPKGLSMGRCSATLFPQPLQVSHE